MRTVALAIVLALAAFVLWPRDPDPRAVDRCGMTTSTPAAAGIDAAGRATVCLINAQRTRHGLAPLAENGVLSQTSLAHSHDMVRQRFFEHASPDGRSVGDRLRAAGYSRGVSRSAGENIAWGTGKEASPAAIVQLWMESPGHRADILRPAFTEIGIGIALGTPVGQRSDRRGATYTTDFGGAVDPSLPSG